MHCTNQGSQRGTLINATLQTLVLIFFCLWTKPDCLVSGAGTLDGDVFAPLAKIVVR